MIRRSCKAVIGYNGSKSERVDQDAMCTPQAITKGAKVWSGVRDENPSRNRAISILARGGTGMPIFSRFGRTRNGYVVRPITTTPEVDAGM